MSETDTPKKDNSIRKLWMPIQKSCDGEYFGILSDDSIDRDGESMSSGLIKQWARTKSLPMLANHENKMESLLGVWKNFKVVTNDAHTALMAQPEFFSGKANPKAGMMKAQLDEALRMGLNVGISIGAIPKEGKNIKKNGEDVYEWSSAELLEGTLVPLQANANASFGHVAKQFDINVNSKKEDEHVLEVSKMSEEVKAPVEESVEPVVEESTKEEVVSEAEVEKEDKSVDEESVDVTEEFDALQKENEELKAKLKSLEIKKEVKAEKKAYVQAEPEPAKETVIEKDVTVHDMVKAFYC